MTTYRWTFVGSTGQAQIFVDYRARKTKIIGQRFIYIHDGIYPYHSPEYKRRYKK